MERIVALRYIDAFYSEKRTLRKKEFTPHIAVGELVFVSPDSGTVSFTEEDGIPEKGLLLPREAIVFEKKNRKRSAGTNTLAAAVKKLKNGDAIGIFWKDIIYFEKGIVPQSCAVMYTEGKLHAVTADAVIVKNPETIRVKPSKIVNHPLTRPLFYVIPRSFITSIERYDS